MRVLIHCQHLLGTGHLVRAALIAKALSAGGAEVTVLSGGMPVAGLDIGAARLAQLPPVRSLDDSFQVLVDGDDRPIDDTLRAARRDRVLGELAATRPDALLIETYPFGRRAFRFELEPLLAAAWATSDRRPAILCSIRDILVAKTKPERIDEIVAIARSRFDHILVHADPTIIRLEASFPAAGSLKDKLAYTGFVADDRPIGVAAWHGEVIVSAGGGAVGEPLLRAALAARPLCRLAAAPWRLLTGRNLPQPVFDELLRAAPPGVSIERHRADFPSHLAGARLSISQAGYNTVLDILRARVPAVLIPFSVGAETEQPLRAALLAQRGLAEVVPEATLDGPSLAAAIDGMVARFPGMTERTPDRAGIEGIGPVDLDGARRSAAIIRAAVEGKILPALAPAP
ncbi:MAG TPA: glycosyltransferase [Stellaceae bacterium]|nr:glycosyltransferase [Stellaceae bacterium]